MVSGFGMVIQFFHFVSLCIVFPVSLLQSQRAPRLSAMKYISNRSHFAFVAQISEA